MRAEIIMALHEPQEIKQQGRCVQNFNQELWYGVRQEIVETGNMAKVLYINTDISYQCSNQNLVLKSFDVLGIRLLFNLILHAHNKNALLS